MTERFISNEDRDSRIPADVVETIDVARQNTTDPEKIFEVDDLILAAARDLQKRYGSAVKHSNAWHKLAGSSVENRGEVVDPDLIREIDDAVADFVRTTLRPFIESGS